MNPAIIIDTALTAGVLLAACNGQVELTAKERPPAQLLELLRTHKAVLQVELVRLQWLWLERVAYLLQSKPEHLLQNKLVEPVDLRELWHTEPHHAAKLIRSCHQPGQYQYKNGSADFEG